MDHLDEAEKAFTINLNIFSADIEAERRNFYQGLVHLVREIGRAHV